ncbi:hypothetical protein BH09PLA1_BH09PLA1_24900 [soil metagenome]
MKFHRRYRAALVAAASLIASSQVARAQTTYFWGGTAAEVWTATSGTRWGTVSGGPYATTWVSGSFAQFDLASSTITGATTQVGRITANGNVTVTPGGTIGTGGTVAQVIVASGFTLDMAGQSLSTTAGTGFIKNGGGTWITANGNSYAGGFTLNAGTIQVGGTNALGNGGALTINGGQIQTNSATARNLSGKFAGGITVGGNFTFGGAGTITLSDNISIGSADRTINIASSVALVLASNIASTSSATRLIVTADVGAAGRLDFTNTANSWQGGITVNGGETRFTADGSFGPVPASTVANYIVIDGGIVGTASGGNYEIDSKRGIQVGNAAGGGISPNTSGGLATITYNGTIANKTGVSDGNLTKLGSGTLILGGTNTYGGATTVSAGTLVVQGGAAIPDGSDLTMANSSTVTVQLNSNETLGSIASTGSSGGNLNIGTNTLTTGGNSSSAYAGTVIGTGKVVKGGSGTLTLTRSTAIGSDFTLRVAGGTIDLNRAGSSVTAMLGATNAVELAGGSLQISGDTQTDQSITVNRIDISADTLIKFNRTGTVSSQSPTVTAPINFKTPSTLRIDYSANVSGGTTNLSGATNTLEADASITFDSYNVAFTNGIGESGGSRSITKSGTGQLVYKGTNTYTGSTIINGGTIVLNTGGSIHDSSPIVTGTNGALDIHVVASETVGSIAGTGTIALGGATLTTGANNTSTTYDGVIRGTGGSLVKIGTGTLTLTNTGNGYNGTVSVLDGVLSVTTSGALTDTPASPVDDIFIDGGTLHFVNSIITTPLSANRRIVLGPTGTSGAGSISIADTRTVRVAGEVKDNAGGIGNFVKDGTCALQMENNSTYSCTTTIANGTVKIGVTNALPTSTDVTLGASALPSGTSGVLDLNGNSQTIASITTAGTGGANNLVNNSAGGTPTFTVNPTLADSSFGGRIGAGGVSLNLVKNGGKRFTITGDNTYTGTTVINAGTLVVDNTHAAAGAYTVNTGGSLGGGGVITLAAGNSVTIAGDVSPGNSAGNLTLTTSGAGYTVLAGGGSYTWESAKGSVESQGASGPDGTPGTDWDKLSISGMSITATSGSKFTIILKPLAGFLATHDPNESGRWVIGSYTSVDPVNGFDTDQFVVDTSALAADQNLGGFYVRATSSIGAGDLELIYVPEPSGGLICIGLAGLAGLRRRQRAAM